MLCKRLFLSIVLLFCLLFLPLGNYNAFSGENEGSVKGTVHKNSATGPKLSGVKVKCGGESDKTDDNGKFKIKGIKKGEHTIKFSKDGYENYERNVKIKAGQTTNIGDRWLVKKSSASATSGSGSCPSGNGLYCGDSGKGQNTNYLYQCTNGSYSLKSPCSSGCQRNAAGKDDSCKAAPDSTPTPVPVPSSSQSVGSVKYKPNFKSTAYTAQNPFYKGYEGHCTWFAWGRAVELMGNTGLPRSNACEWWTQASQKKGQSPRRNSIAVWWSGTECDPKSGKYGHVAYVEDVFSDGSIVINEANYSPTSFKGEGYESQKSNPTKLSSAQIKTHLKYFKGYIYLD